MVSYLNGENAEEQKKRAEAVDMMKHIAAAWDIDAEEVFGRADEGVEDYTIEQAAREMQEEHDAQEAEEGLKRPVEKTLIGDCRKCWCDQCAKLEQCVHLREGALPDGVRPFPCVGCADGMRFKPCEEERCADFEQGAGFNNG